MANETASTHCLTALSGTHSFTVSGHSAYKGSRLCCPDSNIFTVGRYDWEVAYHPNGHKGSGRKYVSVFLKLRNPLDREEVRASFSVTLHDPAMSVEAARSEFSHTFTSASASGGTLRYITKDELVALGCLRDDRLVVRCALDAVCSRLTVTGDIIVPPSDLRRDIGSLLETRAAADTTMRVANCSFKVHRCVLAARSPVFRAQLYGPMKESKKTVFRLKDVDAWVFEILLHFVYNDALPAFMDDHGEAVTGTTKDLLVAANLYGMERLKLICEEKLGKALNVDTVVGRLEFAEEYYCEHLKACCIRYILHGDRLLVVMEREDFKQLTGSNPKVMEEMLRTVASIL